METGRHFGRLLISPFCTQKQSYLTNLLKTLISICSTGKEATFMSSIRALRLDINRSSYRERIDGLDEVAKLMTLFSKKCQHESFFCESFYLLLAMLFRSGNGSEMWNCILVEGLVRILAGPHSISVLPTLDEIYSGEGQDIFKDLSSLVSADLITSSFLESFSKALTSRFDDEFEGAWHLVSAINRLAVSRHCFSSSLDTFLSFVQVQCILCKISRSEAALDLAISLMEGLFGSRPAFHDPDGTLMSSMADLILLNLAQQNQPSQNWVFSSLTSTIRRLTPTSPVDIGTNGIDHQFVNMTRFLLNFPSGPLYQIAVQFIKSFASPKGISKNSVLCSAYIKVVLQPVYLQDCEQLAQDILIDVLEHCEGTSQALDEGYLGCLQEALNSITEQLRFEVVKPLINMVFTMSSNGLSSKRHFGSPVRYQILGFLLGLLQDHSANMMVGQLLDTQLYPLINSLLHCRLQDHSALPFEFQCFVQEHERMILDLVALGSWVQIRSGLRSFPHFLAVYSPTATWIAYGKKLEHRTICFEMYYRWEKLSQGQFSTLHMDVLTVSMLHCLLNSTGDNHLLQRISEVLCGVGDVLGLTRCLVEGIGTVNLKGALQFLPQCTDEVESSDWASYSSRLCQQLILLERKSAHFSGKVTIPTVFDAMLRKEEKVRHMCGPFAVSDLVFLASALIRVPKGRSFENIMIVLINGLPSADENVYANCLDIVVSSSDVIDLAIKVIASNVEYFELNRRFLRFASECIVRASEDALAHLFCFTTIVPVALKPLFASFLWIIISARIPLSVGMELVLEWVINDEADNHLIWLFRTKYREIERPKTFNVDFGLAFGQLSDPIAVLKSCIERFVHDISVSALFLRSIPAL